MPQPYNLLINSLPADLRASLLSCSEHIDLPLRTSLYRPDVPPRYIHFVTSGIASIVTTMENGDSVEVGISGSEGAPESLHLLGPERGTTECFVQVDSSAFRVDFSRFQAQFFPLAPIRSVLFRHIQYQTLLIGQMSACNRLHGIEERLARWLLMVSDRVDALSFALTQEFLAEMIGSRRSTVTLTAGLLRRSGLIDYQRGNVNILDRQGLEGAACECYRISSTLLHNLRESLPGSETHRAH